MELKEKAKRQHTNMCPHCKKLDYIIELLIKEPKERAIKIDEGLIRKTVRKIFTEASQKI